MALASGINCGFVKVAPTTDPSGTNGQIDTYAAALKVTSPGYTAAVEELGWYCDTATEAANFDIGVYTHDTANDRPSTLVGSAYTVAKGTTAGWKIKNGIFIPLIPNTIYWLALQLDDTSTNTNFNYTNDGVSKEDYKSSQTSLASSWGASAGSNTYIFAIYALIRPLKGFSRIGDIKIY